jgi:hypothetical protein
MTSNLILFDKQFLGCLYLNLFNLKCMARIDPKGNLVSEEVKADFPIWKTLLRKLIKNYSNDYGLKEAGLVETLNNHIDLIDQIKAAIKKAGKGFHAALAYELICHACCAPSKYLNTEESVEIVKKIPLPTNTFYSIFDSEIRELIYTDPRIEDILGLKPEQFNLKALLGFDPNNQLFHPSDMPHSIRLGAFAYLVLSIQGLEIRALEDYFRARYRIGVSASSNEVIRNMEYVTLEKSVFMIKQRQFNDSLPTQFLYKISVFTEDDFHGINPYYVSDPTRSVYMNAFHYLFHAYLLGIGTKFILLLDERSRIDRNKAIANSINEKLKQFTNSAIELDEGQIADCFAKTIRPKIAEAINVWENRLEKLVILSDQEAVTYARTLGLLPVPKKVLELIYQNIDAN